MATARLVRAVHARALPGLELASPCDPRTFRVARRQDHHRDDTRYAGAACSQLTRLRARHRRGVDPSSQAISGPRSTHWAGDLQRAPRCQPGGPPNRFPSERQPSATGEGASGGTASDAASLFRAVSLGRSLVKGHHDVPVTAVDEQYVAGPPQDGPDRVGDVSGIEVCGRYLVVTYGSRSRRHSANRVLEPGAAYWSPPRQLPTQPPSRGPRRVGVHLDLDLKCFPQTRTIALLGEDDTVSNMGPFA